MMATLMFLYYVGMGGRDLAGRRLGQLAWRSHRARR